MHQTLRMHKNTFFKSLFSWNVVYLFKKGKTCHHIQEKTTSYVDTAIIMDFERLEFFL